MPKVSVIIPVYNTAPWLRRCLDSVCRQTVQDIEIICIDDGSSDISVNIIQDYTIKDNRIIFIKNRTNKGVSHCRNIGIDVAKGEYISFIDSDDFIDTNFYESLLKGDINYDIIKGNIIMYDSRNDKNYKSIWNDLNNDIKSNKAYFCCAFTSGIYRRNFILEKKIFFQENIKYFEDPVFSIQATINSSNIKIIDNTYYHYRHFHKYKTYSNNTYKVLEKLKAIIYILDYINKENITEIDYIIYTSFLYHHLTNLPNDIWKHSLVLEKFSNTLVYFINNCKLPTKSITHSFQYLKHRKLRQSIKNIRINLKCQKYQ